MSFKQEKYILIRSSETKLIFFDVFITCWCILFTHLAKKHFFIFNLGPTFYFHVLNNKWIQSFIFNCLIKCSSPRWAKRRIPDFKLDICLFFLFDLSNSCRLVITVCVSTQKVFAHLCQIHGWNQTLWTFINSFFLSFIRLC